MNKKSLSDFNDALFIGVCSCDRSKSKSRADYEYMDETWKLGKKLFYDKCSPCHTPILKDDIFNTYVSNCNEKSIKESIVLMKGVLHDENHIGKNINLQDLTDKELLDLQVYIEIKKPEVID